MKTPRIAGLLIALLLSIAAVARAQDTTAPSASPDASAAADTSGMPMPVIPEASLWPGVLLICIFGLFVGAAVIGPIVRANLPDEVPLAHSHDEPPGTSGHHGPTGTLNPAEGRETVH